MDWKITILSKMADDDVVDVETAVAVAIAAVCVCMCALYIGAKISIAKYISNRVERVKCV